MTTITFNQEEKMILGTLKELGYKIDIDYTESGNQRILAYKGAHIVDIYKSDKYDIMAVGFMGEYYYNDGFKRFNDIDSKHKAQIIHNYTKNNPYEKIVNKLA